ncbi:MAG: hypothetical protein R2850_10145 [Bacteroidia bacterium]
MSNLGQNIFVGTAETGQGPTMVPSICRYNRAGITGTILFTDLTVSWLINVKTNMRIEAVCRIVSGPIIKDGTLTTWFFFGIKTMPNRYTDF